MCGFVAVFGRSSERELKTMAAAVAQRGPDDHGHYRDEAFAAIHHRLAIIGPDVRGRQPLCVDDVIVLFNGCIYNYRALRRQLEEDGVRFVTDTDTEVLPHLYRRFGTGMFSLLNGMFAIVLWDVREKRLLVARDPFGEKPLFVCAQDGRIGLASSLSAFERGGWRLTPDIEAVRDVLVRMRCEAPRTMYREIRQLPSGCYAMDGTDGALALRRYFFLPEPDQPQAFEAREIPARVEALLDDAFLLRTVADRPMGVFLSGGVDSSLVAESLARQMSERLHTFSVRFADAPADYDESDYARQVAGHIGSEHAVLEVRADALATLEHLAAAFDQPVTNAAALPTYLISEAAKAHVDVALSGIGGDELFGGYPRYLGMAWHHRLRRLPGRRLLLNIVGAMGEGGGSRNLRGRLRRFLAGLDQLPAEAYKGWTSTTDSEWNTMFTHPRESTAADGWQSALAAHGGLDTLLRRFGAVNGAMAHDILTYLGDDLLAVGDRMSMAHALELRAPFLDARLLALVLTLEASYKVGGPPWGEGTKLLLKAIARKRLPAAAVDRPKQGFMAPLKHWLRLDLAGEIERLSADRPLGGLLRPGYLRYEWERHQSGVDRSDILWGVLLLDRWMKRRKWDFDA